LLSFHCDQGTECRGVTKFGEEGAEESGELGAVGRFELPDDRGLSLEKGGESVFCEVFSGRGEMDEHAPAVLGVGLAFDEPGALKAIESYCHSPAGEEEILSELGWGQRADQVEFGEDFEVPLMAEPVSGGDTVKSRLEEVGGA
jgi:hypothetical protein